MTDLQPIWLKYWPEVLALLWFFLCFRGYSMYASRAARHSNCLASVMHRYRLEWMQRALDRDVRISDTAAIANLERSVAFFASTTILILAGLVTLLGATDEMIHVFSSLPFTTPSSTLEWELKLMMLIALFAYAFFKFTWSLRQYGFTSVMLGGAPMSMHEMNEQARAAYANRLANMMSLAANNFNEGLRTYSFSMAVLGWFVNDWLFALLVTGVLLVLYRREFKSRTLHELLVSRPEGD